MEASQTPGLRRDPSAMAQEILGSHLQNSLKSLPPKVFSRLLRSILTSPELQFPKLDLSECGVDSESMRIIVNGLLPLSKFIRYLYLDGNQITPAFCSSLFTRTVCTQITQLSLAENNLGDDGAVAVANAVRTQGCSIEYLDLSSNNIHSRGAEALASVLHHFPLTWLSLQFNMVGDVGFHAFVLALRKKSKIKSLFLAHNFITDRCYSMLICSLGLNTTLSDLNLRDNLLSQQSQKEIAQLARNRFARIQIQPIVALAYGHIPRLGKDSVIRHVPSDILIRIYDMTVLKGYPTPSSVNATESWSSISDTDDTYDDSSIQSDIEE